MTKHLFVVFTLSLLGMLAPGCKAVTGGGSGGGGGGGDRYPPEYVYTPDGAKYTGSGIVKLCFADGENKTYIDGGNVKDGIFDKYFHTPDTSLLSLVSQGLPAGFTVDPPNAKWTNPFSILLFDNVGNEIGELTQKYVSGSVCEYIDRRWFDGPCSVTGSAIDTYNEMTINTECDIYLDTGYWQEVKVRSESDVNTVDVTLRTGHSNYPGKSYTTLEEFFGSTLWYIDTDSAPSSASLVQHPAATAAGAKYQSMMNDSLADMEAIVEKTFSYCNPYYLQSIIKSGAVRLITV
jgi:hypothetical protein